MPTYTYRRADGTRFDIEQRITEPSLTVCPTTGQPVVRVITGGAGLVFKGTGFYQTDYVRRKEDGAPTKKQAGKSESGARSGADSKAESKAESRTESAQATDSSAKSKPQDGKSSSGPNRDS
jgi:predicted nucleic acid-binding Zn ribbon protein